MKTPEPAPAAEAVTLEEFCASASMTDRRVEMVAGFYADERRSGRVSDTPDAWRARFVAFQRRPVS